MGGIRGGVRGARRRRVNNASKDVRNGGGGGGGLVRKNKTFSCDEAAGSGKTNSRTASAKAGGIGSKEESGRPTLLSSGWLSARCGGPARQRLLKFAFEKKLHKVSSTNSMASVGYGNSCSAGGLVDPERRSPTTSSETTTDNVVPVRSPSTADSSLLMESADGGLESESESDTEPSIQHCHRKRNARVLEAYDSTDEEDVHGSGDLLERCASPGHQQQLGEKDFERLEELECSGDSECEDYSEEHKEKVLDFINGSSPEELGDIPGCTQGKARLLTGLRPFKDWEELVGVKTIVFSIFLVVFYPSFFSINHLCSRYLL